ncbi:spore germination protein [Paenibacillus sp. FSL L8-0340]
MKGFSPTKQFPRTSASAAVISISALMSGRVVIVMEGTPFVLVAPMTFWMLAQSP